MYPSWVKVLLQLQYHLHKDICNTYFEDGCGMWPPKEAEQDNINDFPFGMAVPLILKIYGFLHAKHSKLDGIFLCAQRYVSVTPPRMCESIIKVDPNCHHFAQKVSENGTNKKWFILLSQIQSQRPFMYVTPAESGILRQFMKIGLILFIEIHHLSSLRHSSNSKVYSTIRIFPEYGN